MSKTEILIVKLVILRFILLTNENNIITSLSIIKIRLKSGILVSADDKLVARGDNLNNGVTGVCMKYFDRTIGQEDLAHIIADLAKSRTSKDAINQRKRVASPYEPKLLCTRNLILSSETIATVARAEISIAKSDCFVGGIDFSESFRRFISRVEGIASIRTNGIKPDYRLCCFLDLADWIEGSHKSDHHRTVQSAVRLWTECTQNVLEASLVAHLIEKTVNRIITEIPCGINIDEPLLDDLYQSISSNSYWQKTAGLRTWDYRRKRCSEVDPDTYLPTPPKKLPSFMKDLVMFCNKNSHSPLTKSAIAHYQLEATKAFTGGSDQFGRILAILIWKKSGLIEHYMPPFSITPAMTTMRHTRRLEPYQTATSFIDGGEMLAIDEWVYHCARASELSVRIMRFCYDEVKKIQEGWALLLKNQQIEPRKNHFRLMQELIGSPVINIAYAAKLTGCSFSTAAAIVEDLSDAGIIKQVKGGDRNRIYEAPQAMTLFGKINAALLPENPMSREFLIENGMRET